MLRSPREEWERLGDEEEGSEDGEAAAFALGGDGAEPRTISEIQRSRINMSRRYVFLCPTSLSKHFDALPQQAKDMAILVFRCSRAWFFQDLETRKGIKKDLDTGILRKLPTSSSPRQPTHRQVFAKEYVQWVRTKEKEGLVFWYKPEKDLRKLSDFFQEKIDPVSEEAYRPLLLDTQWWRVRFTGQSARYIANPSLVIGAINNTWDTMRTIDIPVLQELIYQSNPTLEPISKWPRAPSMRFVPRAAPPDRDFVGQGTWCKGYVDKSGASDGSGSALASMAADQSRILKWPKVLNDRKDDLYTSWAKAEAIKERQRLFALSGKAALVNNGSFTAR